MAPIQAYLMNRNAEIALARSAAPAAISSHATILVLSRQGWQTAVQGTNGFVCNVERGWTGSLDWPQVWNPKIRGADCLNPAAARTILPIERKVTQLTLAGESLSRRMANVRAAFASRALRPVPPGAMGYMMSKGSYLGDPPSSDLSHLMFFVWTRHTSAAWGAFLPHVPLYSFSFWFSQPGAESPLEKQVPGLQVLVVPVPWWSDGSPVH
ncbi:MAG: hypothetical protein ACRD2E_07710 [Terriglobales bacterium]